MKRAMFFAAVAAIAAATILSAASAGALDSATGSGHSLSAGELRSFSFSANRLPDGTVQGEAQVNARSLDAFAHIAIDCLQITGNVAHMSGTIVHTSDPPQSSCRTNTCTSRSRTTARAQPRRRT
jgi:hypothetical protein